MSMIRAVVSDLSVTLLRSVDRSYRGGLNELHEQLKDDVSYDVWSHFVFNEKLFALYLALKGRIKLYIFTTGHIQNWPALCVRLDEVFDDVFSAAVLGVHKDDPAAYLLVAKKIGIAPAEILFVDDRQPFVEAAAAVGMRVVHFKDEDQAVRDIDTIIDTCV